MINANLARERTMQSIDVTLTSIDSAIQNAADHGKYELRFEVPCDLDIVFQLEDRIRKCGYSVKSEPQYGMSDYGYVLVISWKETAATEATA